MGHNDRLGEFEQLVLLALVRLGKDAYGMKIRQEIAQRAEIDVSIGAVYTTLERLEGKGFVSSHRGEPTPQRGGRAKRYFEIRAPGIRALHKSHSTMSRMWAGLAPIEV